MSAADVACLSSPTYLEAALEFAADFAAWATTGHVSPALYPGMGADSHVPWWLGYTQQVPNLAQKKTACLQ